MSDKKTKAKSRESAAKEPNAKRSYDIPLRLINGNTNPRNPLSLSLQSQGWDCMTGGKQVWPLAVSDKADERAKFVQLMQDFDPEIVSLAATILSQGLLSPVEVCEGGSGKFRLVFGARRCLAILFNWCLLGKPKEPVVQAFTTRGNTTTLLHRAVVENIRKPQSVIEEARAIQTSINAGEKKDEVCRQLGISISTLEGRLKLLELPAKTQEKLHIGEIKTKDAKREHAEQNGKKPQKQDEESKPRLRKRAEVEETVNEFKPNSDIRNALEWMLGLREKIK